jgi:hypothetical protein
MTPSLGGQPNNNWKLLDLIHHPKGMSRELAERSTINDTINPSYLSLNATAKQGHCVSIGI